MFIIIQELAILLALARDSPWLRFHFNWKFDLWMAFSKLICRVYRMYRAIVSIRSLKKMQAVSIACGSNHLTWHLRLKPGCWMNSTRSFPLSFRSCIKTLGKQYVIMSFKQKFYFTFLGMRKFCVSATGKRGESERMGLKLTMSRCPGDVCELLKLLEASRAALACCRLP